MKKYSDIVLTVLLVITFIFASSIICTLDKRNADLRKQLTEANYTIEEQQQTIDSITDYSRYHRLTPTWH